MQFHEMLHSKCICSDSYIYSGLFFYICLANIPSESKMSLKLIFNGKQVNNLNTPSTIKISCTGVFRFASTQYKKLLTLWRVIFSGIGKEIIGISEEALFYHAILEDMWLTEVLLKFSFELHYELKSTFSPLISLSS